MENYNWKSTDIHSMPNPNWYIYNTTLCIRLKKNLNKMVRKSQSLRSPWYLLWESVFWEKKSSHGGCREGLSSGRSIIKICYIKLKKINKIFYTLLGGDKIQKFWIYYIWNISSENLKVVALVKKKHIS